MSPRRFFYLSSDVLYDDRYAKLPDAVWRRAVELFARAAEYGDDQRRLPISFVESKLLPGEFAALKNAGILEVQPGNLVAFDQTYWCPGGDDGN